MHRSIFDPDSHQYRVRINGEIAYGCILAREGNPGTAICYVYEEPPEQPDGSVKLVNVRTDDQGRPMLVEIRGLVELLPPEPAKPVTVCPVCAGQIYRTNEHGDRPFHYWCLNGKCGWHSSGDALEYCDYCQRPLDQATGQDFYIESENKVLCEQHYREWRQQNER